MRHAQQITLTATPTSLYDLINQSCGQTDGLWIQWVSGTANYGNKSFQPFTIATGSTLEGFFLENVNDTKSIYFVGTAVINVGLF